MKKFKIRSSGSGKIMSDSGFISDSQLIKLEKLISKPIDKPRTILQEKEMQSLITLRDNPQISDGAKTFCTDWIKGQLYNSHTEIKSKYLDKGNIMEDESIDFIADQLGYGFLMKNELHFHDEFMQGTPDIIMNDLVIDVKNSWDCFTFPLFDSEIPNMDYYWQLQAYMNLTNRPKAKLIYCLLDTPEHLISNTAKWDSINQGFEEMEPSIYQKHHDNLTYEGVKDSLKIKVFDIERNDDDIQKLKDRVIMCQSYIDGLLKGIE